MNKKTWQSMTVSPCGTFHCFNEQPLYKERFDQVMKYHAPGLAPVRNKEGAFHINVDGNAIYSDRYIEAYGFYEGLAAVKDNMGWFHIEPSGERAYKNYYGWCGNFQEGFAAVKREDNAYLHINKKGKPAYGTLYCYAGDFKEGIAVVCNGNLHTHIDKQGNLLHGYSFIDLDVYHKGFARAKDERGWFHINKLGKPLYSKRYAAIEPYYNGLSRVESFSGAIMTIDTHGEKIALLRPSLEKNWHQLSGMMVGFWRTEVIASAVNLNLWDYLPDTSFNIAKNANIPIKHLERLLRALWELNLVDLEDDQWLLTPLGKHLITNDTKFLKSAAVMWSDVNSPQWKHLARYISSGYEDYHPLFKAKASEDRLKIYHEAIDGYAKQDFVSITTLRNWQDHQNLIGIGRSAKVLLEMLLKKHDHLQAIFLGEAYALKHTGIETNMLSNFSLKIHDILKPWHEKADAILLPKTLHYWPDKEAEKILMNARHSLLVEGKIYLFEMILARDSPDGSLLDLNMLVESGGKLRFMSEWEDLFSTCQLQMIQNMAITPWLNMLVLKAI